FGRPIVRAHGTTLTFGVSVWASTIRAGGSARLFGQSGTPGGPGGIDEPRGDFVWAPCSRRWTCNFDHGADAPHGVDDRRDSRADGRPRLATWWQRVI